MSNKRRIEDCSHVLAKPMEDAAQKPGKLLDGCFVAVCKEFVAESHVHV